MADKILLLFIFYGLFLVIDWPKLKKQHLRERMFYIVLLLMTFYLAFDYVLEAHLPNLNRVLDFIFSSPAKQILKYFSS